MKNKLEYLRVGEIEIKKSTHEVPVPKLRVLTPEEQKKEEEKDLFWSAR